MTLLLMQASGNTMANSADTLSQLKNDKVTIKKEPVNETLSSGLSLEGNFNFNIPEEHELLNFDSEYLNIDSNNKLIDSTQHNLQQQQQQQQPMIQQHGFQF